MKEASWLTDLWFRPGWVFMKYVHLLRQIEFDEGRIRREGRFKKVREALAAANLALAVQAHTDQPVYVQLSPVEPPDFFLFQRSPDDPNLPWITYVEHTSFGVHPSQVDLASQLRSTKLKSAEDYAHDYILLIEVQDLTREIINAVEAVVREKGITYKVWIMSGRMEDDDERIEVVAFNSPFTNLSADVRHESERFPEADASFVIRTSPHDPREAPAGQPAPWPDPLR